jgi:hypothetical protein
MREPSRHTTAATAIATATRNPQPQPQPHLQPQAGYYLNNFNSFHRAMVTLFELLVCSGW